MIKIIGPRDETYNPDPDKSKDVDPECLLDKSEYGSECFTENPGKELCVHLLSSDGEEDPDASEDETKKDEDANNMTVAEEPEAEGDPSAASTPLREAMNRFRIEDTEPEDQIMTGISPLGRSGDANSAFTAKDTTTEGDANSATGSVPAGDANSAKVATSKDDRSGKDPGGEAHSAPDATGSGNANLGEVNSANTCDANSANTGDAYSAGIDEGGCAIPLRLMQVPAMFKPPPPPTPKPAIEKDAIPSPTYNAIMAGRSVKNNQSVIAGTGNPKAEKNCGSFFNPGDNRVIRSVYKENVATLTVSSLSFNPTSWECSACPKKHSILGGGGGLSGGGEEGHHFG